MAEQQKNALPDGWQKLSPTEKITLGLKQPGESIHQPHGMGAAVTPAAPPAGWERLSATDKITVGLCQQSGRALPAEITQRLAHLNAAAEPAQSPAMIENDRRLAELRAINGANA